MRITAVNIPGFGRLSGFSRELSSGLNVIIGDNEAGKSTLQQAIAALLYGFYDGDRARPDETVRHERFRPWAGGYYRGSMEYELEDGRRFEVRRDFSSPDIPTQLIDPVVGTDISGDFGRLRHGNVPFARKHLGMSRAVFRSCAFISQGEVMDVQKGASPSEIGDAIAALADSARRDVSAARALDRIASALNGIGSDRARTARLPVARDKLARARADLQELDESRQQTAGQAARLEEAQRHFAESSRRCIGLSYQLNLARASTLGDRLKSARAAEERLATARRELEAMPSGPSMSEGLRDEVLGLAAAARKSRETLDRLVRERDEAAAAITAEERLEFETFRHAVTDLSRDERRRLEEIAYKSPPPTGILASLRRAISSLLRWLRSLLPGATEPAEPEPTITQADAREALDRHQRWLALRPLVERLEASTRQAEAEEAVLLGTEARLRATIESCGIAVTALPDALAVFEAAWKAGIARNTASNAADEAAARLEAILQGATVDDLQHRLDQVQAELAATSASHPWVRDIEPAKSPSNLDRDLKTAEEDRRRAEIEASRLGEEVRLALGARRPRAEIEEEIAISEAEVARLEQARSALALARSTIEEAMAQVYRDFAPAVNSFLSEGIEFATEGRYHRAHVDPSTLKVSLLVPETGQVVTDPPVSHGTRTLIYVLMRIGLAQHMSGIGEPVPLILDDPFVDVDARRMPLVLEFLSRLSDRMQILFFTKDPQVLGWLESAGITANVHEIAPPAPARL